MIRVRSTVYCFSRMRAPWGFEVAGREIATFHLVLSGGGWLMPDGLDPIRLDRGDLAVVPDGRGHRMVDEPESPTLLLDDILAAHPPRQGRLDYGGTGPRTELLCGGFQTEDHEARPLLSALPPVLVVPGTAGRPQPWLRQAIAMLAGELAHPAPGSDAVVTMIADLMLADAIRTALDGAGPELMARVDPRIGAAVRLLQDQPDHRWTVAELAGAVGLSRSALGARFRDVAGEPPMRFLAGLRLSRAASYLRTTDWTLRQIARSTGYESEISLSKAFKRRFGMSPGAARREARSTRSQLRT
jgi:AraC-like DNA-binding protein